MELLLGSLQDQRFLRNYLRHVRGLPASAHVAGKRIMNLEDIRDGAWACDWPLFEEFIDRSVADIENVLGAPFELIDQRNWYLIDHEGKVGGFYSAFSHGFCDILNVAFMATPVGRHFRTPLDRALELARGYLHDCFHNATFKSYGVKPGTVQHGPKHPPTLYRYQHGFNFRTVDGVSYSAPQNRVPPGSINLGVLMDGIGTIMAGTALKRCALELNAAVTNELLDDVACLTPIPNGRRFFAEVIGPTKDFFDRYAKIPIAEYAKAMLSGDAHGIGSAFETAYNLSWDSTFRQPLFPVVPGLAA